MEFQEVNRDEIEHVSADTQCASSDSGEEPERLLRGKNIRRIATWLLASGFAAAVVIRSRQRTDDREGADFLSLSSKVGLIQATAAKSCSQFVCGDFGILRPQATCSQDLTSFACFDKCCAPVHCSHIDCAAHGSSNISGLRGTTHGLYPRRSKARLTCTGPADCIDKCCVGHCSEVKCDAPQFCARIRSPKVERCTPTQCPRTCCYDTIRCTDSLTAPTAACHSCQSTQAWCENQVGMLQNKSRKSKWNAKVAQLLKDGQILPGCEMNAPKSCLKDGYSLKRVFKGHQGEKDLPRKVTAVDVLTNALYAITGDSEGHVLTWNVFTGDVIREYKGHTDAVTTVAASPDAAYFLTVGLDKMAIYWVISLEGTEAADKKYTLLLPAEGTAGAIMNTWMHDIVGQSNGFAQMWIPVKGSTMQIPVNPKYMYAQIIKYNVNQKVMPDKEKSAILNALYKRYHMDDMVRHRRLEDLGSPDEFSRRVSEDIEKLQVQFQANSSHRRLDLGGYIPEYSYPQVKDSWDGVRSAASVPAALRFALGYGDGAIRYFDGASGEFLKQMEAKHAGAVEALVPAPGTQTLYSGGTDGVVQVWDAPSGKLLDTLHQETGGPILSMAIVPGGNLLYTGAEDGVVRLWDLCKKELVCQLDTKGGMVLGLAVNPGRIGQLIVASEDGLARVYEN